AVAGRRAKPLVTAHVAGRARHALAPKRRIVVGIGPRRSVPDDQRSLLGERPVTHETRDRRLRVALEHLDQLTLDAGAHGRRVGALAPLGVLCGMAAPA